MVKVSVEMPSGEERVYEYETGASVEPFKRTLIVYTRGRSRTLAVFPLARVLRAEVEAR